MPDLERGRASGRSRRPKWNWASPRSAAQSRSRPLSGLRLLPMRQELHLSTALCPGSSRPRETGLVSSWRSGASPNPCIPYSCHYCGLCQAVCPQGLHAGRVCLESRERLVARGKGPLPPHKGIQNYVKWGASPTFALSRPDPATGTAPAGLFPGLRPVRPQPDVVKAAYAHLRRRLPDTGIMLNCCGAPSYFMGESRRHAADHRQRGRGTGEAGSQRNSSWPAPTATRPSRNFSRVQNPVQSTRC